MLSLPTLLVIIVHRCIHAFVNRLHLKRWIAVYVAVFDFLMHILQAMCVS